MDFPVPYKRANYHSCKKLSVVSCINYAEGQTPEKTSAAGPTRYT